MHPTADGHTTVSIHWHGQRPSPNSSVCLTSWSSLPPLIPTLHEKAVSPWEKERIADSFGHLCQIESAMRSFEAIFPRRKQQKYKKGQPYYLYTASPSALVSSLSVSYKSYSNKHGL
jgi:hypothetical protein